MEKDFDIEVIWKGFEIHPDLPPDGILRETFARGSYFRQVEESLRRLADDAGLILKSPSVIANTHLALEASEFAREQGRFAELHRRLFEAYFQEDVNIGDIEVLVRLANEVGLEGADLRRALDEDRFRGLLHETTEEAHRYGVSGTPTFFIGDERVVGAQPYEVLKQAALRAGARLREDQASPPQPEPVI